MSNNSQQVKFSLQANEFDFIISYQLADKPQLKKLFKIKNELIAKRPDYKRISLVLTLGDIDALLSNITREANKLANPDTTQDILHTLFSKLAHQYNTHMHL